MTDPTIVKKKISTMTQASQLAGLITMGVDANNNSVKIPVSLLKGNVPGWSDFSSADKAAIIAAVLTTILVQTTGTGTDVVMSQKAVTDCLNTINAAISSITADVTGINMKIPTAATSLNQLADKAFVEDKVSTASATFRGTSAPGLTENAFKAWANTLPHDVNDYVWWRTSDNVGNTIYKRYKWDGYNWVYEYDLNNSGFSAAQWAAINSTITVALTEKLAALPTRTELNEMLEGKQDALHFDDTPTADSNNPVKSKGIKTFVEGNEALEHYYRKDETYRNVEIDAKIADVEAIVTKQFLGIEIDYHPDTGELFVIYDDEVGYEIESASINPITGQLELVIIS